MSAPRRLSGWAVFAIVSILLLGCLLTAVTGLGAALILRSRDRGPVRFPVDPTATAKATRTPTPTRRVQKTPTPSVTPTRTLHPVLPTATRTASPTPTQTQRPQTTVAPTATPTRTGSPKYTPTPVVCEGLEDLASLTLVSGQSFTCSVTDQELVDQIAQVPDLPCSAVQVVFADGEIQLSCRMGIRLNAVGEIAVQDCRASIQIVRGTVGFTQVIQGLLDQYAALAPYDRVCVEEAAVGEGVLTVSGYGR